MSKNLVLVLCVLGGPARAAGVDDAIAAVQAAQRAGGGDSTSCKGLPTKLKLALEGLEQARKSSSRGLVQQAKGRLEVAKDLAASACVEAVRGKVVDALASAVTALEKAGEQKVEATGAAFRSPCRSNDECASDHCYAGADGAGYCSKPCAAVSDCPPSWACRRPGSAPQTICIK